MAASSPFNRVFDVPISAGSAAATLSSISVSDWNGSISNEPRRTTIVWGRTYRSTTVLIVGLALLVTTIVGGLILLLKEYEELVVTIVETPRGARVVVAGAADPALAAAIFTAMATITGRSGSIPQQADASKTCPACAESVRAAANVCRFCGHDFTAGLT